MKVGNLVRTRRKSDRGVGILTGERFLYHRSGGQWMYRVIWADGSIVLHTRGTLEVINEKR
jgi:hypothetical protein